MKLLLLVTGIRRDATVIVTIATNKRCVASRTPLTLVAK
jgi:hypothetical protein